MRNRVIIVLVLIIIVTIFYGCDEYQENTKDLSMTVIFDPDFERKPVIPDPVKAESEISAVLRYIPNFEDYEDYQEESECFRSNTADLSFLGFKNEMLILAYQIGTVTSHSSEYIHIRYNIPDNYKYDKEIPAIRDREVHANCLILVVKDSMEEDGNDYVVVLDYENHKSYSKETKIWNPTSENIDHIPEIQLSDLTGDGLDEIVVHNALQEEETNAQVFRFDGNNLACIYSGLETGEDSSIAAYLADNYKAVVEYKPLGFKKSKSLLDLGYTKKQLQDKDDSCKKDKYPYSHVYKAGKLKRDIGDRNLRVWVAQNMKIHRITDYEEVIKYDHFVSFAKYNSVCRVNVYLKYNNRKDALEVYRLEVEWISKM